MENKIELTQLVKEVQKDRRQFELLYSQIIHKVYFWCYTIARDESTANDMTQEAMIRIYNKLHTLRTPETFSSWMYRLVRNSCITYLRDNKGYIVDILDSEDFNDGFETNIKEERSYNLPEEAYCQKEMKELVRGFVENLPRKQREVITLYYLEEFKTTEIAEILDRNEISIRSLLHYGRKNLEIQVNRYQKKHNVKIHSAAVLPLLGLILSEYRDDICSRQNLQYNKSLYNTGSSSWTRNLVDVLSSKLIVVIISVVCVSVLSIIVVNVLDNRFLVADDGTETSLDDIEMFNKSKGHPFIDDITYSGFPMRNDINVTIKLKKDIEENDIRILYKDEELSFSMNKKDILVQVTENGIYSIITKEYKTSFKIDNIDAYAPELVEAFNNDGYLRLVINDELSQVDYRKSFVEYQDGKYEIPDNLRVNGEFRGLVEITLFHTNGEWIKYNLNFD